MDGINNPYDSRNSTGPAAQYQTPSHAPDPKEEAEKAEAAAAIVARAKECYQIGVNVTSAWRKEALTDLQFLAGDQWDKNVMAQREGQQRPALTVNRLPQFVRQVTNEQRQSKPSVTVNPIDDESDIRTAEVLQGVIRNIEYTSNADAAYASGGQSAAITGIGYWDIRAEYEDEQSFDQKLTIRRIPNPMSVVMDPGTKEMAGDDARWVIISTDISKGEWKARFPGREMPSATGMTGEGDAAAQWVGKEGVRIHEYRWIQEDEDTLIEDPEGGDPVLASELARFGASHIEQTTGQQFQGTLEDLAKRAVDKAKASNIQTRPTNKRTAKWATISGGEVIDQGDLAGRYLQLVRVVGTELEIDGVTTYEGVIRHARDTQRMLNYFVSAEAEAIALAPKAPWLMAEGQDEGYETEWEHANTRAMSRLVYKPKTVDGMPVAPPQRVMAEANVSAITNARMQAADDLKAVTGIYDAALGARSNEQSGKAILARTAQGQTANFHFQDNLAMAIRYTGRVLIDLIPVIYSGPRVLRILGEDGKHEMVPVNGAQGDFRGEPVDQKPIELNAGRYDVAVSMGPSYQSRRQEAAAQMLELIRVNPTVAQVAGDLLVESMDLPNGKAIAERIRKTLPPEIRPPDDKQPPPQVLAQQLQQSQQMIQQLTQELNRAHDERDRKSQDNEAKERIELIKVHADLVKTMAALESKEHVALLGHEVTLVSKRLGLVDFNQPVDSEAGEAPQPPPQPPQQQQQAPQMPPQLPPGGMNAG